MTNLKKVFSRIYDESVEVSDNGVLHVDAARLLKKDPVKRQLAAARRLQHGAAPARRKSA